MMVFANNVKKIEANNAENNGVTMKLNELAD